MRFILLLCVSLSFLLAACATTKPEGQLQSQSLDPLAWVKPSYFSSLEANKDYYPNELIAIYDRGTDPNTDNASDVLNAVLELAAQKENWPVPEGLKLKDTNGDGKGDAVYPVDTTTPAITLAPASVCGEMIANFTYQGITQDEAIRRLLVIRDYLTAQSKSLYGVSPKGKSYATPKGKSPVALVSPTSSGSQASLYNSSVAPAFTSGNWSYKAVNAVQGISAAKVRVAVLDTGVNPVGTLKLDAPANFVELNADKTPTQTVKDDFDDRDTSYQDGHGTGVAALIADTTYGIAPGATVIPVKTCDEGGICNDITVTRGICYAQAAGADVINISLGTLQNSPMVRQAIREVVARGSTVVAASGNTYLFTGSRKNKPDYPARLANGIAGLMSVGAIDQAGLYANFATADAGVELVAPGSDTSLLNVSADRTGVETFDAAGQAAFVEGTSFAAPFVAGAAANLYAQCPSLAKNTSASSSWVETILKKTSTPWKPISQVATRRLPWPLSTNGFTPGLLNVGNSLKVTCP
jgi:Subtilase family